MVHTGFDNTSIGGSMLTFIFAFIGIAALKDWAVIVAIFAGITTIVYNCVRIYKDLKK